MATPPDASTEILTPAEIGEYLSLGQCSRFFKHRIDEVSKSENHTDDEYNEAFTPLNLLLSEAGEQFEQGVKSRYERHADDLVDLTSDDENDEFDPDHDTVFDTITVALSQPADMGFTVLFQPTLKGRIAAYDVAGHADFVIVWPTESGAGVRVIDAKSTAEQKSYQQIQAAIYTRLIEQAVAACDDIDTEAVSYSAGVVTRETEWGSDFNISNHPSFDYRSRITDVTRMLQTDGEIAATSAYDLADAPHAITDKCSQCPYTESCTTEAFEASHVRLLGLSESEQAVLVENGITTINELADLCTAPNDDEWDPTTQKRAGFVSKDSLYYDLKADTTLGDRLPDLVYRAEAIRRQLSDPDDYQNGLWIPGTGKCQLPEDDPFDPNNVDFAPNSMIRVYLNVQHDHLRDRLVQLSARVSVSDSDIDSIRISKLAENGQPRDEQIGFDSAAADHSEQALLTRFVSDLNTAIEAVTRRMNIPDRFGQDNPLLQFYTYTAGEYDTLREAIERVTARASGDDTPTVSDTGPEPTTGAQVESSEQLIQAFADTLEGQPGTDTPRVAHIKPEIKPRLAIPTTSYGLLHVYDFLNPPSDDYSKPKTPDGWQHKTEAAASGESVDIRSLFRHRLFNTERAWSRTDEGISVDPSDYPDSHGLKTRYRYGAEIPLGYLWAAMERIDEQWIDDVETDIHDDAYNIKNDINSYLYHNSVDREQRISEADVTALGKHLVDAIEHVERSAFYRSEKITDRKPEVDPVTLWTDSRETATIAAAARDYLAIEHTAQQQERYELYRKLPRQRILSGESIPVKIKSINTNTGRNGSIVVSGDIPYDHPNLFGEENAEDAKLVCKKKGKEGTSGGDWMVANRYYPTTHTSEATTPAEIEMGIKATIRSIDLKAQEVTIELRNMFWNPGRYDCEHRDFTLDGVEARGDDFKTFIDSNEWLILDPTTQSFSADRADKALETADQNALHTLLEGLRWGKSDALSETMFDADQLDDFAGWIQDTIGPNSYPNDEQRDFITTSEQVALLQGPPGTGKTDGTLAPTLCARLFAAGQVGQSVSGLITAPSNTAVDEVLESTADLLNTLSENGVHGLSEETIDIVRVTHETPDNPVDGVEYIHYSDSEGAKRLRELRDQMQATDNRVVPSSQTDKTPTADGGSTQNQSGQATIGVFDRGESTGGDVTGDGPPASEQSHTLIFATPTSSWGMLKKVCTASSPDPEDIANFDMWDLVVADEASMLTLPKLILAGTGMKRSGQLLLGGDHRQLPPVQKHDWEDTHRQSIVEAAPQLSALNYFRLLGGDLDASGEVGTDGSVENTYRDNQPSSEPAETINGDTNVLNPNQRDRLAADIDPANNPIPLIQLDTTFRFGPKTADFIGKVVYDKDGIDYSATEHDDSPQLHTAKTEPLQSVFSDIPITVITYDSDRTFQQVNPIEAAICNILLLNHSHEATAGVVTPHNAQRSRLRSNISTIQQRVENPPINLDNGTQVETVNRFQGGQNDLMIVSATASNPQFIRSESDFLLELNRANVAFSRHKYKLIVVMAESLLSHIPDDPDTYDQSLLWKTLSHDAGEAPTVDADPVWNGTLTEFTAPVTPPNQELADNTDVSVYHL